MYFNISLQKFTKVMSLGNHHWGIIQTSHSSLCSFFQRFVTLSCHLILKIRFSRVCGNPCIEGIHQNQQDFVTGPENIQKHQEGECCFIPFDIQVDKETTYQQSSFWQSGDWAIRINVAFQVIYTQVVPLSIFIYYMSHYQYCNLHKFTCIFITY